MAGARTGDVASDSGGADRSIQPNCLGGVIQLRIKRGGAVVHLVPSAVVRHPKTVVDRQPAIDAPGILRVPVNLPVTNVPRDALRRLRVRRHDAQQHVGVAVARIQRIRAGAAEIVVAHVVGGADRGERRVILHVHAELETVTADGLGQVVLELVATVVITRRHDSAVGDPWAITRETRPVAAGGRENREVRILVELVAINRPAAGGVLGRRVVAVVRSVRRNAWRADAESGAEVLRVVIVVRIAAVVVVVDREAAV